jgi:hypothetical protein
MADLQAFRDDGQGRCDGVGRIGRCAAIIGRHPGRRQRLRYPARPQPARRHGAALHRREGRIIDITEPGQPIDQCRNVGRR